MTADIWIEKSGPAAALPTYIGCCGCCPPCVVLTCLFKLSNRFVPSVASLLLQPKSLQGQKCRGALGSCISWRWRSRPLCNSNASGHVATVHLYGLVCFLMCLLPNALVFGPQGWILGVAHFRSRALRNVLEQTVQVRLLAGGGPRTSNALLLSCGWS
jgi:hypothetical protein